MVQEVVIIDGGSSDDSIEVVEELLPTAVVIKQGGRGKGNAIKEGIAASTGSIVITMDGDGSMDPGDIKLAVEALLSGADFVKGSRMLPGGGSSDFTWLRRAGNALLTRVANVIFGSAWTDITYGFNGYWRAVIGDIDSLSDGFEFEIQAAVRATRSGLHSFEISSYEAPRVGGRSKLNPLRDGCHILRILLSEARPSTRTCFRSCADLYLSGTAVEVGSGEDGIVSIAN